MRSSQVIAFGGPDFLISLVYDQKLSAGRLTSGKCPLSAFECTFQTCRIPSRQPLELIRKDYFFVFMDFMKSRCPGPAHGHLFVGELNIINCRFVQRRNFRHFLH